MVTANVNFVVVLERRIFADMEKLRNSHAEFVAERVFVEVAVERVSNQFFFLIILFTTYLK